MAQTTVQHADTIRFGSGIVEIGDSVDSLVNVGAITGVAFSHSFEKTSISSDNAGVILEKIGNEQATVSGNFMETGLPILAQYIGGLGTLVTIPGSATPVTGEAHTLGAANVGIRLDNKNGNDTIVTDIVVKKGGVAKTLNEDYGVFVDAEGWTAIYPISGGTLFENNRITVDYNYTPATGKRLNVGGRQKINANVVRITNINSEGKKFEITVYKATANSGIGITFNSDDSSDVDVVPFELVGTLDVNRVSGAQLFTIVDEQSK